MVLRKNCITKQASPKAPKVLLISVHVACPFRVHMPSVILAALGG